MIEEAATLALEGVASVLPVVQVLHGVAVGQLFARAAQPILASRLSRDVPRTASISRSKP